MERAICEAGAGHRWTIEQSNALLNLVLQPIGYLHLHGHALATAQRVFRQARLKVNPRTSAAFFAEILNNAARRSTVSAPRRRGALIWREARCQTVCVGARSSPGKGQATANRRMRGRRRG